MSDWIAQTSNFSVPIFNGDKVAGSLSLIYSCDAPGMEDIREQAVAALLKKAFFRGVLLKEEAMISEFQEHEDLRKTFLASLLQRDQTQMPLLAMLNHESMYSFVVKNAEICRVDPESARAEQNRWAARPLCEFLALYIRRNPPFQGLQNAWRERRDEEK